MNTLIVGGVTISNSLKVAAEVVSNEIYRELIEKTIKEVEDGNSIQKSFVSLSWSDSRGIPELFIDHQAGGEGCACRSLRQWEIDVREIADAIVFQQE